MEKNKQRYITKSYLNHELSELLLQDNSFLSNVEILDLTSYLKKYSNIEYEYDDNLTNQIKAFNIINSLSDKIVYYKDSLKSFSFSNAVLNLYTDLLNQQFDINDFMEDSLNLKELKLLLLSLKELKLKENYLKEVLNENINYPSTSLYCYVPTNKLEENILNKLNFKNHFNYTYPNDYEFYHAKNSFEEIDWVCQDIVKNANKYHLKDITITASSMSDYFEIIEIMCSRYNIPCNFYVSKSHSNYIIKHFLNIVELKRSGFSLDLFKNILRFKPLNIRNISEVENYLDALSINEDTFLNDFNYLADVSNFSFNDIKIYEEYAKAAKELFLNKYGSFISKDYVSFTDYLNDFYNLVISYDYFDEEDINCINKINDTLSNLGKIEISEHYEDILINALESINCSQKEEYVNAIRVTDIDHPLTNKVNYVVGVKQSNYPSFSPYKNLLNEFNLAKGNFEPLEIRYNRVLNINKSSLNGERVVLTYPCGSYEGKSFEVAFEIEKLVNKKSTLIEPIYSCYDDLFTTADLDPTISNMLFFNNNEVKGSISSFEKYFNCPFSYYISSGLKVYPKNEFILDTRLTGTLTHALLEKLVKQYGKKYCDVDSSLYKDLIKDDFEIYLPFFKSNMNKFNYYLDTIIKNVKLGLNVYRNMELSSSYMPFSVEEKFENFILEFGENKINIKGFVDRIDRLDLNNKSYYRIVDYKTYNKSLDVYEFLNGVQIQLITYMYAIKKRYSDISPLGIYYCHFRNASINDDPLEPLNFNDNDVLPKSLIDNYKLNGFTLTDNPDLLQEIDHEAKYVKGLKISKDGFKNNAPIDYQSLFNCLEIIYGDFINKLAKGDIDIDPIEDGCKYCEYKAICRYEDDYRELKEFTNDEGKKIRNQDALDCFIRNGGFYE